MRYEAQLNQHINTSPLKTAMQGYLNTFWDMSDHLAVDLTGFAFLFKDPRYRRLCQRWCWGPVAQLFSVDVFKKLKTSRLEGVSVHELVPRKSWLISTSNGIMFWNHSWIGLTPLLEVSLRTSVSLNAKIFYPAGLETVEMRLWKYTDKISTACLAGQMRPDLSLSRESRPFCQDCQTKDIALPMAG